MTNTIEEFNSQVVAEAIAAADRYGFEPSESFDGYARVAEGGAAAVFRVRNQRTAEVQVTVVDAGGNCRSDQTIKLGDFEGVLVADPGYEFLEVLDESLTDAFRRADRL
jgi:hypothetical protein